MIALCGRGQGDTPSRLPRFCAPRNDLGAFIVFASAVWLAHRLQRRRQIRGSTGGQDRDSTALSRRLRYPPGLEIDCYGTADRQTQRFRCSTAVYGDLGEPVRVLVPKGIAGRNVSEGASTPQRVTGDGQSPARGK